ncbi:MAG TPA: NAD(P)H-dependent oxidoreductase [Terracidiphilus sp.]|nr:NAD(P)H-dependent oxidoreductase [Terracidiphilus sp.]
MNSLVLLNGSPRGERSNSMKMLKRVAEGWVRGGGAQPEVLHLVRRAHFLRAVQAFAGADVVLLGMPLYTDAMPALVKGYIEALAPRVEAARAGGANPTLAFLVQGGFPEAAHSRPLERYLKKLAMRMGSHHAGTIVRGGGESLQAMPDQANRKLWAQLKTLGEQLARDGSFGAAELKAVAGTERFSRFAVMLASLACRLPVFQFYWNGMLKKNGVWDRRFAAPYGAAFEE